MFFSDFCKEYKLDKEKLKPMALKLMRDFYPGLSTLSDHSIIQYGDVINLPPVFYIKLAKLTKLWTFS